MREIQDAAAATSLKSKSFGPERWWSIVDFKIGIIPLPIYLMLLEVISAFAATVEQAVQSVRNVVHDLKTDFQRMNEALHAVSGITQSAATAASETIQVFRRTRLTRCRSRGAGVCRIGRQRPAGSSVSRSRHRVCIGAWLRGGLLTKLEPAPRLGTSAKIASDILSCAASNLSNSAFSWM